MKQAILLSLIFISFHCFSKTWKVGKTKTYTAPSQVSTLVSDGDTIDIDSGLYVMDVAKWTANNLLLRGVNGRARLDAQGKSSGSKAIWVIAGKNTRVENIEFFNCKVPDHNGAGIRLEGSNLTVVNCFFHHNEMGLLAGDVPNCKIIIEKSELSFNGYGDGYTHNIYVNHIDTFVFRYNYSHDADVGHEVKSRAYNNFILYNRISSENGNDSRNIDLPNGGKVFLIGNVIEQGSNSQNSNIVGYGLEGLTNPVSHKVYAINNTVVNNRSTGSFFNFQSGTELFKAYNNIIAGNGTFILGTQPAIVDTSANVLNKSISAFNFENASAFKFKLTSQSTIAIDKAVNPGNEGSFSLSPEKIYVHPISFTNRCNASNTDVGAYEYCKSGDIENLNFSYKAFPNPASDKLFASNLSNGNFKIFTPEGKLVSDGNFENYIDLGNISKGLYWVYIFNGNSSFIQKFIKE